MSKKISKIEEFNHQNVVTLNQRVTGDRRYLILDLWEDIELTPNSRNQPTGDRYRQIFLQINNLEVLNFGNGRIYFDLENRNDVINSMIKIEDKIMLVLKNYLEKINKRGKFNFRSVMKDESTLDGNKKVVLALNVSNHDYEINMFDSNKRRSNYSILNTNSTFNIILELMYIQFDMKEGMIMIDTRLRLIMQNQIKPERVQLTNIDNFIDVPQQPEQSVEQSTVQIENIKKNFDSTQTEVFEDDETSNTIRPEKGTDDNGTKPDIQLKSVFADNNLNIPDAATQETDSKDIFKAVSNIETKVLDSDTLNVSVNILGDIEKQCANTFSDSSNELDPMIMNSIANINVQEIVDDDNNKSALSIDQETNDNETSVDVLESGESLETSQAVDSKAINQEEDLKSDDSVVETPKDIGVINEMLSNITDGIGEGFKDGDNSDCESDIMVNLNKIIKDTEVKKKRIMANRKKSKMIDIEVDSDVSSVIDSADDVVKLSSDSEEYDDNIIEGMKKNAKKN